MSTSSSDQSENNARQIVERYLADDDQFGEAGVEGSILFADLVGSTEFKHHNTPRVGLAKTYLHNWLITKQINSKGGRVVKYLGDGVMGIFEGKTQASSCLRCALDCFAELQKANTVKGWTDYRQAMSTRIGVHCGKVWMFRYDGTETADPHGSTVDIAARLAKLADFNTTMCSVELFEKAGGESEFPNVTKPRDQAIRGLKNILRVRLLYPLGTKPIGSCGFQEEIIAEKVKQAKGKKPSNAIPLLKDYLKEDPVDFHANVTLGEFTVKRLSRANELQTKACEEAETYLNIARSIRPNSSWVWRLLAELRFRQFQHSKMPEHLNEAKDCARRSMSCAEGGLNQGNALLAKLVLADLLSHDWKNPTGDNTSHSEALAVTDELKTSIPNFTKEIQSRYLVIRCKVLLASKDINYPLIEEMANNAKTLDHECFEAFQILEEMARRQGGDD